MAGASFFDGIPPDELRPLLDGLPRRRYPAGATVIAEGESLREICVTQSGSAEVCVSDRRGVEHVVGHARPGTTLGEMSLFTGQPAVGTVRAVEDLEVIVVSDTDFERIGAAFPQIYRNLGSILSERLARTDRLVVRDEPGRLIVLEDHGAPPLLAYALACSVAWHTRASTLLLLVGADRAAPVETLTRERLDTPDNGRAALVSVPASGAYAPDALAATTAELCGRWEHVLVSVAGPMTTPLPDARTLRTGKPNGAPRRAGSELVVEAWARGSPGVGPSADGVLGVPALEASDERALREGRLASSTAAGRALGWLARDLAGLKVGVALGAGSIRGFAHWGVLDGLEELGVPIDCIAGSSVGGSVAAMYATGFRGQEGVEVLTKGASTLFRPTLPVKSLLSSRALAKFVHSVHGDDRIEDLELPLAIVTADIRTQRAVVLRRGRVDKAVLATLAIPGIFPAQRSGSYILVDGGVLHPVPTGVVADMGADVVIGVRLLARSAPDDIDAEVQEDSSAPQPSALATIVRSIEMMQTRVSPEPVEATSIVITPELENIPSMKLRNFSAGIRYVESGLAEVRSARPRIAAALPWLRT